MKEYGGSNKFGFTVSHTTRSPRPGEINGVHYHFTTMSSMENAIDKNEFLEYAHVHGNMYGTSLSSLLYLQEEEKLPLLDIDVQGVKKIKECQELQQQQQQQQGGTGIDGKIELEAKYIFIAPPSLDSLLQRLVSRGTETEESIQRRSKNAVAEMEYGMTEGNFDAIVVNDDLDQACKDFNDVINRMYFE